jgi:flagellar hook-length control protein FliK
MPELMISPTPTPSRTDNANALSQSEAANRSGESAKTDRESGAESPFAAVLKSRMDKKTATTDEADSASSTAVAQTDAKDSTISIDLSAISIDLSAIFPLLAANNPAGIERVETAPVTAEPSPDENLLLGLQVATEQTPAQILAALPTAPPAALPTAELPAEQVAAVPTGIPPTADLPTASATTLFATPTAIMDRAPRKQNVDAKDETFSSAGSAKSGGTAQVPDKMTPDAAINAAIGNKGSEKTPPELSASDFRALMERAAAMTPAAASPASSSSSPSLRIDTPLGQTGWHDEVGQKLTWMVGNNRQQADLVLNPPQFGRVEVSLTMNGDQATAIFTSSNPAVREALEGSMHRLREVLADAGVSLGQAQVGSESPRQSSRQNELDFGMNEGIRYASTIPLPEVETVARSGGGRSMIDIFA